MRQLTRQLPDGMENEETLKVKVPSHMSDKVMLRVISQTPLHSALVIQEKVGSGHQNLMKIRIKIL